MIAVILCEVSRELLVQLHSPKDIGNGTEQKNAPRDPDENLHF
jgi:hypothetical protein